MTPEFWPCVDRLTLQTTALLLPLIRLMDKHFPDSRARSLRDFYEDLHAVVATAGYLSIGMRRSRTIFRFSSPMPGDLWDLGEEDADHAIYTASVAANEDADSIAEAKWEAERHRRQASQREEQVRFNIMSTLRHQAQAMINPAVSKLTAVWERVLGRANQEDAEERRNNSDMWHRPGRVSNVQIVLWPKLQRFETCGGTDPETGAADMIKLTTILKAQVVYYHGRPLDDIEASDHSPRLGEWVQENKRQRMWCFIWALRWVVYAAGLWLLLSLLATHSGIANVTWQIVKHGLAEVAKYVAREVILFVMEVVITIIALVIGVVKVLMFLAYGARNISAHLFGLGMQWLWGTLSGLAEAADGRGGRNGTAAYPSLSWELMKGIARTFVGDVVWKPITVRVPVGYNRAST